MKLFGLLVALFTFSPISYGNTASQLVLDGILATEPEAPTPTSRVTGDYRAANNKTFDYIVIGGGLTGLTVASRLSEDDSISVLVIEAGNDDRNNKLVSDIYEYGKAFDTDLVWHYPTERCRSILGGKTLGGGSSINGMTWTRGAKAQYDAMHGLLGLPDDNPEWKFEDLFKYMKKAEKFTKPTKEQSENQAGFVADYHGMTGPVNVAFPKEMYKGPQQPAFVNSAMKLLDIDKSPDLNGGNVTCVSYVPNAITPGEGNANDTRSSSASAYLTPSHPKWLTLVSHRVTKIRFSDSSTGGGNKIASKVEFRSAGKQGDLFFATASKDVILAAGAIHTPQILQLSGVGDFSILDKVGVDKHIELKTVGRNLQEQTMSIFGHSTRDPDGFEKLKGGLGPSDVIAFPSIYQLYRKEAGANSTTDVRSIIDHIYLNINKWAESQAKHADSAKALEEIFRIQADLITFDAVPLIEVFYSTGYPADLGIMMWNLLPFSRGRVAITSNDPFVEPETVVNYFNVDFDLDVQVAGSRLSRRILNDKSFSEISMSELIPGNCTCGVPLDAIDQGTDDLWRKWIKKEFQSVAHPVGTAAMMRKDLGGVVDGHLRVYGTENLRVVDASILPLQISAHLSSTLYGVAEKAACLINPKAPSCLV